MADKKKKNYAEALKAQMPSKPADPSKETIEVDMDGQVITVVRKDMTDEAWENVKKRAVQVVKPTSVMYETGGEPTPAEIEAGRSPDVKAGMERADKADATDTRRRALQQLFENPHYQVGAGSLIPDEDTRDLLKKMPVEKAVDYLEKRLQHQEWKQKQNLENSKKLSDETQPADKTVNPSKPSQGAPSEWDAQKPATTGGVGTQTENDGPYVSDAGPGMSVRGNMAQMAMGALGSLTGASEADTDAALARVNAQGEQHATEDAATLARGASAGKAAQDASGAGLAGAPQRILNTITNPVGAVVQPVVQAGANAAKWVGNNLDEASGLNAALAEAAIDPGVDYDPATAMQPGVEQSGVNQSVPPEPLPVQPPGGGMGMSMSAKAPGGFSVATPDAAAMEQYKSDAENARSMAMDAQSVIKEQGKVQTAALEAAAKRQMTAEAEAAGLSKLASEARLTAVQEARRYQTAQSRVAEEARQAAANPTDPNRYWNDKNIGQRAAAVISGMLFGYTGQGMQWLQRLDGLVESDMNAQRADRASKVQGLEKQAQILGEAGQRAMQFGATEAEAHLIERQSKLEGLKSYLDIMTMKMGNAQQQMQGAQMSAQIGQHIAQIGQQGAELAQQAADSLNQARYQNASLRQEAWKASLAAQGQAGGDKLAPAQQGIISSAEAALGMLPELEKAIGNPKGEIGTALYDQITKQFPGTDANNRDIQAAFLNRTIFAGIDKSVINAADQAFLDKLQSAPGIASLRAPGAISALRRMITQTKNAAIRTAQSVGQRTGSLRLSPEGAPLNFTPRGQ